MLPLWIMAGIVRSKKNNGECCVNNSNSAGGVLYLPQRWRILHAVHDNSAGV